MSQKKSNATPHMATIILIEKTTYLEIFTKAQH